MKHLKYLAALPLLVALIACEAAVAPPADEPATEQLSRRPAGYRFPIDTAVLSVGSTSRAAAVAEPSITATKQSEARDHVTVTGPWAPGWYISGVYFDVPQGRPLPPNPLTGIKRNLTVRCDVGVSFTRGRGFVVADLPQNKRRPEPDGFDLYVTVRRDGGYEPPDREGLPAVTRHLRQARHARSRK